MQFCANSGDRANLVCSPTRILYQQLDVLYCTDTVFVEKKGCYEKFFPFAMKSFLLVHIFFLRTSIVGGGGAARLFLLSFFPCSADHERDWLTCKVVFSGWQPIRRMFYVDAF